MYNIWVYLYIYVLLMVAMHCVRGAFEGICAKEISVVTYINLVYKIHGDKGIAYPVTKILGFRVLCSVFCCGVCVNIWIWQCNCSCPFVVNWGSCLWGIFYKFPNNKCSNCNFVIIVSWCNLQCIVKVLSFVVLVL